MRISCHQMLKGHSQAQAYHAPMLESKDTTKPGSPKSFSFAFNDDRRELSGNDTNNYVLEIEPVNGNFDCTAAICTQYTDVGTPAIYTNWIVPENGDTRTALKVLERKNFLHGQDVADVYDRGKTLTMVSLDVSDAAVAPAWQMTDGQRNLLGQFLALYWMRLAQNQPALGAGKRLFLLLHDPASSEPMKNEEAVRFFSSEIVTRLPSEALSMLSAVFGVRKIEAENNFKKAVCVVLSSETGVPADAKIDLFKGNQDIIKKLPSRDDREAMYAIANCLLAGESNYPEWYIRLRSLKQGIPKTTAPYLMYFCFVLQQLDAGTFKPMNPLMYYEQCYRNMYLMLTNGGTPEDEAKKVLQPLLQKIASIWGSVARADMEFYRSKRNWVHNDLQITGYEAGQYIAPLAEITFTGIKNNAGISTPEKIENALEMLDDFSDDRGNICSTQKLLEDYLSENFEEWLFMLPLESNEKVLPEACFARILSNWKSSGLRRQPDEVKEKLLASIGQYPNIPEKATQGALFAVDKLCLKAHIKKCRECDQHGEQLSVDDLRSLARQYVVVGNNESASEESKTAAEVILKHYHNWILIEPVFFQEDKRFLGIAKEWLDRNVKSVDDYSSSQIADVIKNITKTLSDYDFTGDDQEKILSELNRKYGIKLLEETEENNVIDDSKKALKIAGIHRMFRRMNGVLTDHDDLEKKLETAISNRFIDWSNAEKPFASSEELRYDDNWFVSVAENWLKDHLKEYILDFNAQDLQKLEGNIKLVFDAYRIPEEQKNRILQQIRVSKYDAQLLEIIDDNDCDRTKKALKIAGIHKALRKTDNLLDIAGDLAERLQDEMLQLFCAWQEAEQPFASDEELRYEDDWFVDVANKWLQNELVNSQLNASQLDKLQQDLVFAYGRYRRTREQQAKDLMPLYATWGRERLEEIRRDADDPDNTEAALGIAEIHTKLKQQVDSKVIDTAETERELQSVLRDYFIAWGKAEKPFASGSNQKYEDAEFFEAVARDWLTYDLNNATLAAAQIEQLIDQLTAAFTAYKIYRDKQNEMLLDLYKAWGFAQIRDVQFDNSMERVQKALCIADIHNRLRRVTGALEPKDTLSNELENAILELFLDWEKAERPFASSVQMRYEDDWFVSVAQMWLRNDYTTSSMETAEITQLEKDFRTAFNAYQVSTKKQDELLLALRLNCCMAMLSAAQQNSSANTSEQALDIAAIHNTYRVLVDSGAERNTTFEREIKDILREYFVVWSKAERPFASGRELRYDDNFFVSVADDWLQYDLLDTNLTASEIDELEQKISKSLFAYRVPREKQNEMLLSLQQKKGETRLREVLADNSLSGPEKSLRIADIHNKLRIVPNALKDGDELDIQLQDVILDYFIDWSNSEKPFASGPDLHYDDNWFGTLVQRWCNERMNSTDLDSDSFSVVVQKIEEAARYYRLRDWDSVRRRIREKNAELCVAEESGQAYSSDLAICRIAEMLLNGDIDQQNTGLYNRAISIITDNFEKWAMMEPPFKIIGGSIVSYQSTCRELLQKILHGWYERKLSRDMIPAQDAEELRARIKETYDSCRVPREYENELQALDYIICKQRFDTIRSALVNSSNVVSAAGIRKKVMELTDVEEAAEFADDITRFLKEHIMEWANASQPFSVEGAGYQDKSVPSVIEEWLTQDLPQRSMSAEDIRYLRFQFTEASKQYQIFSKKEIAPSALKELDIAECDAFCRTLPTGTLSEDKITQLAYWFEKIPEDKESLLTGISERVSSQFIEWSNYQPAFSVGDREIKSDKLIGLACIWVKNGLDISSVSSSELQKVADKIRRSAGILQPEDTASVIGSIDCKIVETRLNELRQLSCISGTDTKEIAYLYNRTVHEQNLENLQHSTHELLFSVFAEWGTEGNFEMKGTTGFTQNGFPLSDLVQEWIRTNPVNNLSLEQLTTLIGKYNIAARNFYHNDENSIRKTNDAILRYEAEIRLYMLNSGDQSISREEQFLGLVNLYEKVLASSSAGDIIVSKLKDAVFNSYEEIVSVDSPLPRVFVRLACEWSQKRLPTKAFGSLQDIRNLQNRSSKKCNEAGAGKEDINTINKAFELVWINSAVEGKANSDNVSVSEVAASGARLKAMGHELDRHMSNLLDSYLKNRFWSWLNEGFRSEFNGSMYTYESFPDLACDWAQHYAFNEPVESLESLIDRLERALSGGYSADASTIEKIRKPIEKAQKNALLQQTVMYPTDENLNMVNVLYDKEPAAYYDQVFSVYIQLAQKGLVSSPIEAFIASQSDAWSAGTDSDHKISIARFLENLWDIYGDRRPDKLQETMADILEMQKYRLPPECEHLYHWSSLKENLLKQEIDRFLRFCTDPGRLSIEWNYNNYGTFGLYWEDLAQLPFFDVTLKNWFDGRWVRFGQTGEKIAFAEEVYRISCKATDTHYKSVLLKDLLDLIRSSYEDLCIDPANQDKVDDIVRRIASNAIDVTCILNTQTYKMGQYRKDYHLLLQHWDVHDATDLLRDRPYYPAAVLSRPGTFSRSERWLFSRLLCLVPADRGYAYWSRIFSEIGTPEFEKLNNMDLKAVAGTTFLSDLQWCYDIIAKTGIGWIADELKLYIKEAAPTMWRNMHRGFPFSGIKELVKDGWRGLPEQFSEWLRD